MYICCPRVWRKLIQVRKIHKQLHGALYNIRRLAYFDLGNIKVKYKNRPQSRCLKLILLE